MRIKRCAFLCILSIITIKLVCYMSYWSSLNQLSVLSLSEIAQTRTIPRALKLASHYYRRNYNSKSSKVGYVLSTHYVDQMSGSVVNAFIMQCWAASLPGKVKVVEPFLHYGSMFGVQLDLAKTQQDGSSYERTDNSIRLFDLYDKMAWEHETVRLSYSEMVAWEHFLSHSPRQLILVDISCMDNGLCMSCGKINFFESNSFLSAATNFASVHNYTIIRKACYDHQTYFAEQFIDVVYGDFQPDEVVVIFNRFGGFETKGNLLRINMEQSSCLRNPHFAIPFSPHTKIQQQSQEYIEKFMPNASRFGYISIAFRAEQLARRNDFKLMNKETQMARMELCVQQIVNYTNRLKKLVGTKDIFLSTDSGTYGSAYFRKVNSNHFFHESVLKNDTGHIQSDARHYYFHDGVLSFGVEKLHKSLFGEAISFEKRIESIAVDHNPGHVALLEMVVAANATCAITVGGGMFQERIAVLHQMYSLLSRCFLKLDCLMVDTEVPEDQNSAGVFNWNHWNFEYLKQSFWRKS